LFIVVDIDVVVVVVVVAIVAIAAINAIAAIVVVDVVVDVVVIVVVVVVVAVVIVFVVAVVVCLDSQRGLDVGLHRVGVFLGAEPFDRSPFFVHQKFGEIPFYGVDERAALGLFQILPQRIRIRSIHFNLFKKIKGDAVSSSGVTLHFGV